MDLKAFRPTKEKVKVVEFHAVQPWLAMADVAGAVTIWDWESQQVVMEMNLGVQDEAPLQDAQLQRLAEREPQYWGHQLSGAMTPPKSVAAGPVRDLRFLDTQTCFWQLAQGQSLQHGATTSQGIPHLGRVRGIKGRRWLVIACETKIMLQDLMGGPSKEVPRSIMDSRPSTRIAFTFIHSPSLLGLNENDAAGSAMVTPIMAVGTAAGTIYLISVASLQLVARLVGHKASINALISIAGKEPGAPEWILSGAADGSLGVWDLTKPPQGVDREITPRHLLPRAHEGAVYSMTLFQSVIDSPENPPVRLLTAGEDKKVAAWDLWTWAQSAGSKPMPRGYVTSVVSSPRGGAALGGEPPIIMVGDEYAVVFGMFPGGSATLITNLETSIPAGGKKFPKLYQIAVHPLQPHILAVGSNTGVALLMADGNQLPPVCGIPMKVPVEVPTPPADPMQLISTAPAPSEQPDDRGATYIVASGGSLWQLNHKTSWKDDLLGGARQLSTVLMSKRRLAGIPSGRVVLAASSTGTCVSVVWPETSRFAVYSQRTGEVWERVDEGSGTAVVWALASPTYAVLHQAQVRPLDLPKKSKKKKNAAEEERAAAAALASAQAAAAASATVQVFQVSEDGRSARLLTSAVNLSGEAAAGLYGGALLGVKLHRVQRVGGRAGRLLQFYSWGSFQPVGRPLAAPRWLAWDPDVSMAALAYSDAITLCSTRPSFGPFATVPLKGTACGVWHRHMLLTTSLPEAHCIFATAGDGTPRQPPFVEVRRIASLAGGVAAQLASGGDATAALPCEQMRCGGPTTVIGVREGVLWLVDSRARPFVIPMAHAGLRARYLAAHGDFPAARAVAEKGLWREHHDQVAKFMAAMGPRGAEEALRLSGLSLREELRLASSAGQLRRAQHCLEALAWGSGDRATLNAFPLWQSHTIDTLLGGGAGGWGAGPSPLEQAARAAAMRPPGLRLLPFDQPGMDNSDADPSKDVDWDSPLELTRRLAERSSEQTSASPGLLPGPGQLPASVPQAVGAAVGGLSSGRSSAGHAPPSQADVERIAGVADDALRLADLGIAAGLNDVAGAALRILLRGAEGLAPNMVAGVLARCARCGLDADLRAFAIAAALTHKAPPEIAAVAAVVQADPRLMESVLSASGLVAMAAVYSHAWRSPTAPQALGEWSARLTEASGYKARLTVQPPT